jgi:AcrR family transcriptional regulator
MSEPKSKSKTPPAPDAARERIVTAARSHFFQHGFRGVTMDDLASEMGMSKKTLYVHFQSKRELLDAAIEQKLSGFGTEMDAVQGAREDFADTLRRLLECMRRQAQEIGATFVRDLSKEDPSLFLKIKTRRREIIGRTFGRVLGAGQKAGAVRRDVSADLLVEILLGVADAVATPENLAVKRMTPSEVLSAILSVFLNGVLTERSL